MGIEGVTEVPPLASRRFSSVGRFNVAIDNNLEILIPYKGWNIPMLLQSGWNSSQNRWSVEASTWV
jgi:hypothetical protein